MLMVCSFSIIVLVMIATKSEIVDIMLYLGVFAVASFRIVPCAARMLTSFQAIKHMEPGVKILLQAFDSKNNFYAKKNYQPKNSSIPLKFQEEINLTNLSFSYPIRKEFSLSKISMTIKKEDFIGIIG